MTDLDELRRLARGAFNARNGIGPEAADWNSRAHANEAFHRAFEDPMTVLVYAQLAPVTLRDAIDRLPTVGAAT